MRSRRRRYTGEQRGAPEALGKGSGYGRQNTGSAVKAYQGQGVQREGNNSQKFIKNP